MSQNKYYYLEAQALSHGPRWGRAQAGTRRTLAMGTSMRRKERKNRKKSRSWDSGKGGGKCSSCATNELCKW